MNTKKYSSMIGNVTVRSNLPYIVYGSVRGLISQHRTAKAAMRSAESDRRSCARAGRGAYSDVEVYYFDDGWISVQT